MHYSQIYKFSQFLKKYLEQNEGTFPIFESYFDYFVKIYSLVKCW